MGRPEVTTGIIHPGAMGASLATTAGGRVVWAGDGRSPATHERATASGATDVRSLSTLAAEADIIVSVCPPASARDIARSVAAVGFGGIYVDANAVAPATAREIGALFDRFVDGGIIGPPARQAGTTRIYLSGTEARTVATVWDGSVLDARTIGGGPGAASALKMSFAGWTKGSAALLLAIRALARAEGVEDALLAEWGISMSDLAGQSELTAAGTAPKAWRFAGEMEEIAAACSAAGVPDGFHLGAAELYERMAGLKDMDRPGIETVLAAVLDQSSRD